MEIGCCKECMSYCDKETPTARKGSCSFINKKVNQTDYCAWFTRKDPLLPTENVPKHKVGDTVYLKCTVMKWACSSGTKPEYELRIDHCPSHGRLHAIPENCVWTITKL